MKSMKKLVLLGCAALNIMLVTVQANAADEHEGWGCKDQATRAECMHDKMEKMQAKHVQKLHDDLKITAEQEQAWKNFVVSLTKFMPVMMPEGMPMHHAEKADAAKPTAPDRLAKSLEMLKKQEARLTAFAPELNTFYAQLTAEQKKEFDVHAAHHARTMQRLHQWMQHQREGHEDHEGHDKE